MIRLLLVLLTGAAIMGCEDDNPYWDASNWDMNQTADRLVTLLQAQTSILSQASVETPLPASLQRELWALVLDEYDTAFEVYVRLNRNGHLIAPFCATLSDRVEPAERERQQTLEHLRAQGLDVIRRSAPSLDAWESLEPRLADHSASSLITRCMIDSGFQHRNLPEHESVR